MAKAILTIGYTKYVLDVELAVKVAKVVADAEIYEHAYHRAEGDTESFYTYHAYPQGDHQVTIDLISDDAYNVAKLAGKPGKS